MVLSRIVKNSRKLILILGGFE